MRVSNFFEADVMVENVDKGEVPMGVQAQCLYIYKSKRVLRYHYPILLERW